MVFSSSEDTTNVIKRPRTPTVDIVPMDTVAITIEPDTVEDMEEGNSTGATHRNCYRVQSGHRNNHSGVLNGRNTYRDCHRSQSDHRVNQNDLSSHSKNLNGHLNGNYTKSTHRTLSSQTGPSIDCIPTNTCNNNNNIVDSTKSYQNFKNSPHVNSVHINNHSSHRGCTQTCPSDMECSDTVNGEVLLTSQAWWDLRPKSRDPNNGESRTTVSLESVDLWESDTEESDKDGFDRINGVPINPRKTFDFSDLRRARGHVTDEDHVTRPRSRRHVRESEKKAGKGETEKCRLAVTKEKSRLEGDRTSSTNAKCILREGKPQSGERKQTVAERLKYLKAKQQENELKQKQLEVANKRLQQQQHQLMLEQQHQERPSEQEKKPYKSILSQPKSRDSKQDISNTFDKTRTTLNCTIPAGFVSKLKPRVKLVPGLHTQPELSFKQQATSRRTRDVTSSAVFMTSQGESKMASVEEVASATYPLRSKPGSTRRVKFNQVVSVRDGEHNLKDELRTSKNSAQLFKQKYLLGISNKEETIMEDRPVTPTPDHGCYVQLAY